jgi:dephospho-CoA kinase
MLRVGLTGGIGSGKTTVAKIFEVLGVPVYYADAAARRLMNEDPRIRQQITAEFGDQAYTSDGNLNRSYISSIVFTDPEKLAILNAISHPVTIQDGARWMSLQSTPYSVKEAAIIFETGSEKYLDYIIGVSSPLALRIQRISLRDNLTEAEILKRMDRQMDEEEKMKRCDFLIHNDDQHLLIPAVVGLHKQLLELAKQPI